MKPLCPSFAKEKELADLWFAGKPPASNLWPAPPDENIAPLVHALNTLPFLYTLGCCGGHVHPLNHESLSYNRLRYSGSWVSFKINGEDAAKVFVQTLRVMVSEWPGALVEELPKKNPTGDMFGVIFTLSSKDWISVEKARSMNECANARIAQLIDLIMLGDYQ